MQTEKNDCVDDLKSELKQVKALLQASSPIFQNNVDGSSQPKPVVPSFADIAKQPAINDEVLPTKLGGSGSGGSRKFWWGGFEAQNLKNSDGFTKIESDFLVEIENSNVFFAQNQVVSKEKKKKKVFTKIETDFSAKIGNSNVFFAQNQVVSKKKKVFTFRLVGGDASRNGAELFEIEADFSAKIVTFRLVGGDASPPSPPKSATGKW